MDFLDGKHILVCACKDIKISDAFRRVEKFKPATDGKDAVLLQLCVAGFLSCID